MPFDILKKVSPLGVRDKNWLSQVIKFYFNVLFRPISGGPAAATGLGRATGVLSLVTIHAIGHPESRNGQSGKRVGESSLWSDEQATQSHRYAGYWLRQAGFAVVGLGV